MTNEEFDARITRLTERHEALTQSVEMMLAHATAFERHMEAIDAALEKLISVMQNHERRISGLEGAE